MKIQLKIHRRVERKGWENLHKLEKLKGMSLQKNDAHLHCKSQALGVTESIRAAKAELQIFVNQLEERGQNTVAAIVPPYKNGGGAHKFNNFHVIGGKRIF